MGYFERKIEGQTRESNMSGSNPLQNPVNLTSFLRLFRRASQPRHWPDQRARSWAREVKNYPDLPEIYKPFFREKKLDHLEPFPYTVVSPTFKGGHGRPENERLLWISDRTVNVLEFVDGQLHSTYYNPEQIVYLERGSILLHAWISIMGQDAAGINSTTIRYNAVTDPIMAPFLSCLRVTPATGGSIDLDRERSRFDFLSFSNFKFMSYGQASIQQGARVNRILLQPQIRHDIFRFSGFNISRLIQPSHLIILTDGELIIIRDDDSQPWSRKDPYGAIWSFISRERILDSYLTTVEDDRMQFIIELSGGKCLRIKFGSEKSAELTQLINQLKT